MAKKKKRASIKPVTGGFDRSDQLSGGGGLTPAPGYGPPGSPQAPPGLPAPPPMPQRINDSSHSAAWAQSVHDYQQTMDDLTLQRGRLGFDTGYDATGNLDPRNPYSQAMHLQNMWQQNRAGTTNSMAAQGQLYSGARGQALGSVDTDYQRNSSSLQEQTRRGYEDMTIAQQRAGYQHDVLNKAQIDAEQAGRWQENEQEWMRMYG